MLSRTLRRLKSKTIMAQGVTVHTQWRRSDRFEEDVDRIHQKRNVVWAAFIQKNVSCRCELWSSKRRHEKGWQLEVVGWDQGGTGGLA